MHDIMEIDKFEYVTNTMHELKNPLTTISLACDILKAQCKDNSEKNTYLNVISCECDRMKKIINSSINSLKNNYFDVDTNQNCDIHVILQKVADVAKIDGIGLYLMATHHNVKGNLEYLETAFHELLENSRKHQSDIPLRLRISTFNKGNKIKICFSDNGIGIQKNIDEIFEKDYCDKTDKGLGLYYLKRNMQRINGTVSVESKTGRGTMFTITLPIIV